MKKYNTLVIVMLALGLVLAFCPITGAADSPITVTITGPDTPLKMGQTPTFEGRVTNTGTDTRKGLVVYLSLVSLKAGHEEPMDLEDWSAHKAVRLDSLKPGESNTQQWSMRLISSGKYGLALTVVDPQTSRPIISNLLPFHIEPKPMLDSGKIIPVALGEPALLLMLLAAAWWLPGRRGRHRSTAT